MLIEAKVSKSVETDQAHRPGNTHFNSLDFTFDKVQRYTLYFP